MILMTGRAHDYGSRKCFPSFEAGKAGVFEFIFLAKAFFTLPFYLCVLRPWQAEKVYFFSFLLQIFTKFISSKIYDKLTALQRDHTTLLKR
jgi:hypothetical protein